MTRCCSGSTENPVESFQTARPCGRDDRVGAPDPTTRAFRIYARKPYFFLAAFPRADGAARNEMPVRMAFC